MKKVYICSPYRGDIPQNTENACRYCRYALLKGYLPVAPHLYFTRFLDDGIEAERRMGMFMGTELLKECAELWVFGIPSEGMKEEIKLAQRIGIPVRCFEEDGKARLKVQDE